MDLGPLTDLLHLQSGVISRTQALEAGLSPHDLRRLVRRRELAPLLRGVYVDHTGPPTWQQRAWAAVLYAEPAALCDLTALQLAGATNQTSDVIHVAVGRQRKVVAPAGIRIHRVTDLETMVLWHRSPPRVRVEQAALAVAARAKDEFRAVQVIADAVQSRRTTVVKLWAALADLPRLRRRRFLGAVLADTADGACSVLEHGYLNRVERAHGLPRGDRQVRASAHGTIYRDVLYRRFGEVVELDGRLHHDNAAGRHRDLDRDLAARVDSLTTVRLGWGQVFGTPCRTAAQIATLLHQGGWSGEMHRCPDCPASPTGDR